jgi:hypothetical protein
MSVPPGVMLNGLQDLTPDQVQRLMGLGGADEQQNLLSQQMKIAEALRGTPQPRGAEVGRGNIYVAPHPLAQIGSAALQLAGMNREQDIAKQQQDIVKNQMQGRQDFFDWYKKQFGQAHPQAPDAPGNTGDTGAPEGGDL